MRYFVKIGRPISSVSSALLILERTRGTSSEKYRSFTVSFNDRRRLRKRSELLQNGKEPASHLCRNLSFLNKPILQNFMRYLSDSLRFLFKQLGKGPRTKHERRPVTPVIHEVKMG